jgi:D-threo-aldose 1-dehydrogenase
MRESIEEILRQSGPEIVTFDCAGKYGAGLALETLGTILTEIGTDKAKISISNKLGWKRVPLRHTEPTFEPGVWVGLQHDAILDISYQGMLDSFEQGNLLLGSFQSKIVSVHDPDEYLLLAIDKNDEEKRRADILEAYRALFSLKAEGKVQSVGVGSKDLRVIEFICDHCEVDWIMTACCLTPYSHTTHAAALVERLSSKGIHVVNSAVFNSGFLLNGEFFNYTRIHRDTSPGIFEWRDKFMALCHQYGISPAHACIQFSFLVVGVKSIALNPSSVSHVVDNLAYVQEPLPKEFWETMSQQQLIK